MSPGNIDNPNPPDNGTAGPKIAHVYIMLTVFFSTFLVLLVIQLLVSRERVGEGATPHSPYEFPEIYESPLLQGLESLGSDENSAGGEFHVPPPPFSEDIYPCTECHEAGDEDDVDPEPREFEDEHSDIVLNHGNKPGWCYMCHNPLNRDTLKLADGTEVDFRESYKLCGQCHGTKLRDWRAGVHGRRMGMWDGPRRYLLCAHCHNPHSPKFKPLKPLPPPARMGHVKKTRSH